MFNVSFPPVSVRSWVATNCFRPRPFVARVFGLTALTLAMLNLSPALMVCVFVPVTIRLEPDCPAPVTVTPPVGAVPQVCFCSEFERTHFQPAASPITPLRYMSEMSFCGLNCVTLALTYLRINDGVRQR